MSNQLCDGGTAGCVGFTSGDGACPSGPVVCVGGELVVQGTPTCKVYASAFGELSGTAIATASTYNSTMLTVNMVNPFCEEALVIVAHEFGINANLSDTDKWTFNGDVSIVNGTLFTGGLTGQFTMLGRDGTATPNSDTLVGVTATFSYEMVYVVAASAAFSISQLARIEALTIGGPGRTVGTFDNALKAAIQIRVA